MNFDYFSKTHKQIDWIGNQVLVKLFDVAVKNEGNKEAQDM